ncbi:MAG TPA: MFS transporter [Candidatus Paceibacterota bacterium]|jgi:MFS family permease|nr:MFS transporter [Candidatus Paceibacterota bacterium]
MAQLTASPRISVRQVLLREKNLRWYLGGQVLSLTGSLLQTAVQALLIIAIVGKEEAATWTGLVYAFALGPGALLGPFVGVLLDRFSKRNVMMVCATIGTVQALVFAYLTYTTSITVWTINALALIMGFVNAVDGPGRNAIIKDAVAHKHVEQSSALFTNLYSFAQVAGPGMAGYLVIAFGYPGTFLLNALSFVALIIALANMRLYPSVPREHASVWGQVKEGARYTFGQPKICACALLTAVVCTFGFASFLLLAYLNKYVLGGGLAGFSNLSISSGAGWFAGTVLAVILTGRVRRRVPIIAGMMLNGLSLLVLAATTDFLVAMVSVCVAGAGFMLTFSTTRASIVFHSKKELMGMVSGYTFSFFFGGVLVCALVVAPLVDHLGSMLVLGFCGVSLLVASFVASRLRSINELDIKDEDA